MRVLLIAVSLICLLSCAQQRDEATVLPDTAFHRENGAQVLERHDYALIANSKAIALRAWENELNFGPVLGDPDTMYRRVLGDGADTHMGATIETRTYPGLKIEFYIPKGKDNGWVMNIQSTDRRYSSSRGARVGDGATRIKQLYSEGSVFPDGRNDPKRFAWYIADESNYSTLKFEITEDTVSQIDLYHELP